MITLNHFLVLGAVLFCIGLFGALSKRNAVAILMSIEIMLNAVNITLVAYASAFMSNTQHHGDTLDRSGIRRLHHHGGCGGGGGGAGDDHRHLPAAQDNRRR